MATLRAILLVLIAFTSAVALAQDAGDDDGGAPDASVSTGGGGGDGTEQQDDPTGEETDDQTGRVPTACQSSNDCASGFSCSNQRCVWSGVRRAHGAGCLDGGVSAFVILGAAFALRGRRNGGR